MISFANYQQLAVNCKYQWQKCCSKRLKRAYSSGTV